MVDITHNFAYMGLGIYDTILVLSSISFIANPDAPQLGQTLLSVDPPVLGVAGAVDGLEGAPYDGVEPMLDG